MAATLGCAEPQPEIGPSRPAASAAASAAASLRFEVLENRTGGGFRAGLTVTNRRSEALGAEGWDLYFSFNRQVVPDSVVGGAEIDRLNGDFFRLRPTADFEPLAPGASRTIFFEGRSLLLKESDAPAGPYFVWTDENGGGSSAQAVTDYMLAPWPAWPGGGSGMPAPSPTAASRFEAERGSGPLPLGELPMVVPSPFEATAGEGRLELDSTWTIEAERGLETEADHLADLKVEMDCSVFLPKVVSELKKLQN